LRELESEAIFVFREIASQFEHPVLLFSGGKDSILLVHLAKKAFHPGKIPFPLLHIDTGHNFPETIAFRDELVEEFDLQLEVGLVQEAIDQGLIKEEEGLNASRNKLQTFVLLNELKNGGYDVAIGGGRRDEEKSRAKERFFSHRNSKGQWDPKHQRPELWHLFNGKMNPGEHFRVFPISNWTELDVWQYIAIEAIKLPDLYFSHNRKVLERSGTLLADSTFLEKSSEDKVFEMKVRCRTIGDMTCTGVWESEANSIYDIIAELATTRITERGGRADDKRSDSAMEERKQEGYF
jgi:sulfate adenylyltransferase subunit 2